MNKRINPDSDRPVHRADEDAAPESQQPRDGDTSHRDAGTRDPLTGDRNDVLIVEPTDDPDTRHDNAFPRDLATTPGTPVTGTHDAVPATDSPATSDLPERTADRPGGVVDADRAHTMAGPLLDQDSDDVLRRWQEVQAGFVDDPRDAVQRADSLLDEVASSLRNALEARTTELQGRWKNTERNDTEDLRTALRDYRTTLEQFLSVSAGMR